MMLSHQSFRRLVLRALSFATMAALLPAPASLQAQSASPQVPATRITLPTLAASAYASLADAGPVPSSQSFSLTLTLKPTAARAAALDSFLADLHTSSSPSYHQWITPQQFAASYGATADQLSQVTLWAQAQGLTVAAVSPTATRVTLTGSAAQVEAAFGTTIDRYQQTSFQYFANATQPSLPAALGSLVTSIDGLENLPADLKTGVSGPAAPPATLVNGKPSLQDVPTLSAIIDANTTPVLSLDATFGSATLTAPQQAAYQLLFRQAAAQGLTTVVARTAVSLGFPAGLAEVTALALPNDQADAVLPWVTRPGWQTAPGLPADGMRDTPDLTAASLADFTAEVVKLAGTGRLGNIAPVLYALAPTPGLYTQADAAPAGTWEPATGLGLVDIVTLDKVYPRGTGQSFTSFQATNYSPIHGQGTSFTSNVTSGTGGPVPTGTVAFTSSTGTVLATATLVSGTASATITNLDGGNLTVDAVYSGDATYAPSTSPTGQLFVQPEPSALTVAISGNPVIGGSYTVTVTDTVSLGQPSGPITVTISGTSNSYNAALQPATANSSSASVTIPATMAGTLTLSVMCTTSANYSCYNPYTTTVTIAKATPTLSISYSPNPPVSGAGITLNAVVSTVGTAAAPTGSVTFFDNGTTLNARQLNGGSTTTTGTVPTTATHNITATYAGDANYNAVSTTAGGSTSGTINTSLFLNSSATTVTAGQNITFTATLTPASTGPANPSGSVTFFDGGAQIGTANLVGTSATFTTSTLSATVNHTITAIYSGDGYYGTSTSNAVGLTSNNTSNATTTNLVISASNPVHGSNVVFTATVAATAGGAVPTGTVTFTNTAGGTLGQGTLVNGIATFSTNQLPGGTSIFTAAYSGNATLNPSFSSPASVTLNPEPVTLTISVPSNATFGASFIATVTVTGASGVAYPTGTVTVTPQGTGYSGSSQAGVTSAGTTSQGSAGVTVQATGAGQITITATYAGDKNFAAAGPVSASATIAQAVSKVVLSFNPTTPVAGQSTTLIAKVAFASSIAPTGTVRFMNGNALIGTAVLDNTGTALLVTTLAAGNQAISAVYSGDANYAGGTSPVVNTVTGATVTATSLSLNPNPVAAGGLVTFTSSVGPVVNGIPPSGSVQFLAGGQLICTGTLVSGTASCLAVPPFSGSATITAVYSGDATYAASTSPGVTLSTTAGSGGLSSTIAPASAPGGTTVFVTATATAPAGTVPTGSITATVTNAAGTLNISTASATLPGTGASNIASVVIPVLVPATAGTYNVTVSGANTNFTFLNNNLTLVSTGSATAGNLIATTTVLTATASTTITSGTTLTAVVTPASAGTAGLTGTVVFYDGATQIGIATVAAGTTASSFVATTNVTLSAAITHSLTAVYSGDTRYAGSVSQAIPGTTGTTTLTTPTVTLTANTTTGLAGGPIVLTATVTGTTAGVAFPAGVVTFYTTGSTPGVLGTATLGQTGANAAQAVLSTTLIASGSQSVYAVYSGNANFGPATSNFLTLGLTDYTVTFNPPSLALTAGSSGQVTATLGIVNGFAGTVSFGCTPPPNAGITCSFSPTVLNGSGITTLTVNTVASHLRQNEQASLAHRGLIGGISLAGLLCLLLPAGRRRRLPAMLLVLVVLALSTNLGCSDNGSFLNGQTGNGTALGTSILTITTAGSNGTTTVRHNYTVQVTVQ